MIKLQSVSKEYRIDGDETIFYALKDVNLSIKDGEFTSIMGPSGSGKSTLMHLIGLLDQPTSGKIMIENQDISSLPDNELSKLRNEFVGFVFQQFNLINKLTIIENIILPSIYSIKTIDFDPEERAMELINRFGLAGKEHSYPNKISGGQQQRVAIARALIMRPKLILADEPTGNLDTKTGDKIMELFKELNTKDKITVVIVTHEADIAAKTRRIIKIIDGKLV